MSSAQRQNKKKTNKQPLKPALSGTEKKLLEMKTRQIEKEMTEPTKMKIFDKIKYVSPPAENFLSDPVSAIET